MRRLLVGAIVAVAAFAGVGSAVVLSSSDAQAVTSVFCTKFVPNEKATWATGKTLAKWAAQNPGESTRWDGFQASLCAGESPALPAMASSHGLTLNAAGEMALQLVQPPTTTTSTTVPSTTTTTTTTTTTPPPPVTTAFGVPWNASGLANLELGKFDREVGYRFVAAHSGPLSGLRVFLKQGSGYSAGDGGDIRVDLYLCGSDGLPTGSSLGNYTVTAPTSSQFWTFPLSTSLTAGTRYCAVWSNSSSGQATNYVSLNNMDHPAVSPMQPEVSDADFAVYYRDGSSPFHDHLSRTPILDVAYADGFHQGQQYIDFMPSQRVTLGSVTETITPTAPRSFTKVHAYVGGTGPVTFSLAGQSVTVSKSGSSQGWVTADLAVSLSAQSYPLVISGSGTTIYPYQKGTAYGFSDPFPQGRGSQADRDWPVYLT